MEALSGFALGVVASIKPNPLGLALLAPWAQRWWFLGGVAVGLPTALFLGLTRFGLAVYGGYAEMLRQYSSTWPHRGATFCKTSR